MLAQRVREHPGRTLFQESPLPGAPLWSYEAIARRLERTAAVFLRAQRGRPRVAILSSNGLDGACADLACLVHGIPVTPLNPETDPEALGFILDRLRVNVVVAETDELRARAERAPGRRGTRRFVLDPTAPLRGAAQARLAEALAGLAPAQVQRALEGRRAAVPRRARDRHVHLRQHRPSEGRRAHRPRARHEALRARGGAAGGGRGRGAAVLPAALPHVRPLPRDDGDAVLGRDVRLRRQPVLRHAGAGPALGAAHRPRRHPAPLGAAARAVPRAGRGRRGAARGRRGPPALGALRRRPPRPGGVPLLPAARRRAVQRVRDDRGHRRDHDDARRGSTRTARWACRCPGSRRGSRRSGSWRSPGPTWPATSTTPRRRRARSGGSRPATSSCAGRAATSRSSTA